MSHFSSMEEDPKEMQLFSSCIPHASSPSHPPPSWPPPLQVDSSTFYGSIDHLEGGGGGGGPSLDLKLSISVAPLKPPSDRVLVRSKVRDYSEMKIDPSCVEALKWQAAEQIRLAAMEKSYAERLRELTRREMELAQAEFARARSMWERARDEVERVEKMKERAALNDSMCLEITCQSCRLKFRP